MPSAAEIQAYLSANPGMSDADIAAAMNQYGVSTADMAAATGSNLADIQSRYDAVQPAAAEPAYEPAADPYQPAYEAPAPVATSPFVSAFSPSNFVEPVDEPAPVSAPEARGIASLPPQAPAAPEQAPIVGAGITSLAPQAETPPVVQPEGILSGISQPDINTVNMPPAAPVKPTDQEIVKFLTDNPNTTDAQIAKIMQDTGLNPADIARATGSKLEDVTNRYEAATAPTGIASLAPVEPIKKEEPVEKTEQAPVKDLPPVQPVIPVAPEITYGTDKYTKAQVTDYIGNVMNDATLAPWEKTNKIMESAQKAGMTTDDLKSIYGKDVVDPYLKDYGAGIKSYITDTLADPKKSDFEKLAAINQAADKYGLDTKEISSYAGMNEKGVQKVFDSFETGLKSIVTNLSAPTVSDIDKTKGALQLQSKYGITDDQIAKALGGNLTGKDVKAYLDPVKNFAPKFQEITADNTKTAADIRSFIDDAKKDPRISGLYGLAIQNAEKMLPVLGLRDSMAGKGTPEELTKGYTDFVAAVNADPALKEKYGAQADAIDKVAKMSQRIADEQYGGKLQPHMFQTFIGLDQKTMGDIPKTLEMTAPETRTITDSDGQTQTYTVPGTLKDTKGYEPVYTTTGSGEGETRELAGYTKPVKTSAGVTVDAQYDAQGNLTGYRGRPEDKVWPQHRVGITGVWDANGKAMPEQRVETPGFAKGVLQDLSSMGLIGQLAIAAATGGLGSLAAGALEGALGSTLAKAAGSGLVSGAMSEIGGGKFGKGFLTGAIGNPLEALTQNLTSGLMPNIDTGNATLNEYIGKALPNLASSTAGALINKKDVGDAALGSLLNTGTNMATSSLISGAMPDTLTPDVQKMFTGVSGQLLSDLLKGQTPDVQKAVMGTIMKNAMSSGKDTAKSTAKGKTMGDDFDFEGGNNFDISSFLENSGGSSGINLSALGTDVEELDLSSIFNNAGNQGIDFSGFDNTDITSLLGTDFSKVAGDYGDDLGYELARTLQSTGQASSLFSDDGGFSMDANFRKDANADSAPAGSKDETGSTRSLASTDKDTSGGTGLKATGRGQLSIVDPETGATGITGEGFKSVDDLLGSGTAEEIARYTPGTADYALRSGLETEGGQGFNADSTRGMSLAQMGGGQGLSKYIPAQYRDGETTPIKGTGGTLSETGFLSQSSAANPLGSKYSLGDPRSFINNPTITGQQSVVSPGRTIIDNKDGTYKVVTNTIDGTKTITTNKDGVDKIIRETKTIDNTKANAGAKAAAADKKDNNMLMMLLALMAMMNKGGGGKSTGSGGTIPMLSANRTQLPYGPVSGGPAARPGAGGVNYFSPTTYTPKAAGGGLMSLAGGGMSNLGSYSDGGRLLKGPGDGVSDSIPATIGGKQPARLATGEFVVPARIVSELGNGSTEAGAKKLYAMMDRVQKARRKTKNVAADTKAQKYLPA